ncbi:MAG: NAD(P)-dependent oxidoreductase [Isosphaeraceae bacterium]
MGPGTILGPRGCGAKPWGSSAAARSDPPWPTHGKALGLDVILLRPLSARQVDKALGIRRTATLHELLAQAEFVSLHCYLDENSHHLMNEAAFRALKPGVPCRQSGVDVGKPFTVLRVESLVAGADIVQEGALAGGCIRRSP